MPTITDIIIFRQVDNKKFNLIIKYMVHDKKIFLFFNPNYQWIYFLYILIGLSPKLLMAYLYRHSSDETDTLTDSMPFHEKQAFSAIESMTYCFSIFLRTVRIFSNNIDFVGIGFGI